MASPDFKTGGGLTVLMPVYNALPYLETAVESIRSQWYEDWTMLCLDDASTDGSSDVLERFTRQDARIRHLRASYTRGLAGTLNWGLAQCRTKYVARMDADDYSNPNRFQKQLQFLADKPDTVLLGTWGWRMDVRGGRGAWLRYPTTHAAIRRHVRYRNPFLHSSVIFRRDSVQAISGYDPSFQYCPDFDLWSRLARHGARLANLPEALVGYRVNTPGSLSQRYAMRKWWENIRVVCS